MKSANDSRVEKLRLTQSSKIKGYAFHTGDFDDTSKLIQPLGIGGSSVVYKVFQELDGIRKINVPRALKLFVMREDILSKDASTSFLPAQENFLEEIKNISQISHENLVQVIDAGEHDFTMLDGSVKKVPFLITHLITGCTLREVIENSPNAEFVKSRLQDNPEVAIQFISQIARGISYLHYRNFLHCDIAPKNIFIENGQHLRAIVGDVGMSRKIDGGLGDKIFIAGTKSYSPEDIAKQLGNKIDAVDLKNIFQGGIFMVFQNPLWSSFNMYPHFQMHNGSMQQF